MPGRGQDGSQNELPYIVKIDENARYMDEEARWTLGRFATCEEAVAACRRHVDMCLEEAYQPGMSAAKLYDHYKMFGEDPFIVSVNAPPCEFSAWRYAEARATEMARR